MTKPKRNPNSQPNPKGSNRQGEPQEPKAPAQANQSQPPKETEPRWYICRVEPQPAGTLLPKEGTANLVAKSCDVKCMIFDPTPGTVTWMIEQLGYPLGTDVRAAVANPIVKRELRIAASIAKPLTEPTAQGAPSLKAGASGKSRDERPVSATKLEKPLPLHRSSEWNSAHAKLEVAKGKVSNISKEIRATLGLGPKDKIEGLTDEQSAKIDSDLLKSFNEAVKASKEALSAFIVVKNADAALRATSDAKTVATPTVSATKPVLPLDSKDRKDAAATGVQPKAVSKKADGLDH